MKEAHRRSIRAGLKVVEERLGEVEEILLGSNAGVTKGLAQDLSPRDAEAVLERTARLKGEVESLFRELGLERDEVSTRREVRGILVLLWEILEDMRPRKLGRYGKLAEEEAAHLGPYVERMLEEVEALLGLLEGGDG